MRGGYEGGKGRFEGLIAGWEVVCAEEDAIRGGGELDRREHEGVALVWGPFCGRGTRGEAGGAIEALVGMRGVEESG